MQNTPPLETPPLWISGLRMALRLVVIAAVVWAVHRLSAWVLTQTDPASGLTMAGWGVIALLLAAYAVLIAIPFVPGVEIGVALMVVQGASVAPFVYLATVSGLMLAFFIGLLVPYATLHHIFADLRLRSACRLLDRIAPLSPDARLRFLSGKLPAWAAPFATRYRYLTLAALINIPGNSVIGGGGGLAMLAGLSRLYGARVTALTLALAVAPIPFLVWITGSPAAWFT